MSIKTLSRTGTPGYHNPDIVRRHDGMFNIWKEGSLPFDDGTYSAQGWHLIGVEKSFKDALSFCRSRLS